MSKNNQLILDSELKDKEIFKNTFGYNQMSKLPIGKIILIIRNPLIYLFHCTIITISKKKIEMKC